MEFDKILETFVNFPRILGEKVAYAKHETLEFFGLKPLYRTNLVLALQILVILVLIYIGLASLVQTGFWNQWDMSFSLWVGSVIHSSILDSIAGLINDHGDVVIWYDVGFILCIPKKTRKLGILLIAAELITSLMLEGLIKIAVGRVRPYKFINLESFVDLPTGYSFPSGHSMSSFVAATMFYIYNKKIGKVMYVVAAFFAFTRIYLFAHFLTDVVAGAVLGIGASIIIFLVITEAWTKIFDLDGERPHPNVPDANLVLPSDKSGP